MTITKNICKELDYQIESLSETLDEIPEGTIFSWVRVPVQANILALTFTKEYIEKYYGR